MPKYTHYTHNAHATEKSPQNVLSKLGRKRNLAPKESKIVKTNAKVRQKAVKMVFKSTPLPPFFATYFPFGFKFIF